MHAFIRALVRSCARAARAAGDGHHGRARPRFADGRAAAALCRARERRARLCAAAGCVARAAAAAPRAGQLCRPELPPCLAEAGSRQGGAGRERRGEGGRAGAEAEGRGSGRAGARGGRGAPAGKGARLRAVAPLWKGRLVVLDHVQCCRPEGRALKCGCGLKRRETEGAVARRNARGRTRRLGRAWAML